MAFQLEPNEPVGDGLHRVLRKELKKAIQELSTDSPNDQAIHEARRHLKKTRAILQLLGDELEAKGARRQLRKVARALAPLRDAAAALDNARTLCRRERRGPLNSSCATLLDTLARERRAAKTTANRSRVFARAIRRLEKLRRRSKKWHWDRAQWPELSKAIERSYRRARKAMRKSRAGERTAALHEWRKRIKTLTYGLRLLEERAPAVRDAIPSLRQLEEWLGEDHDLAMLRKKTLNPDKHVGQRAAVARIEQIIERRQRALRQLALGSGDRLLTEPPLEATRPSRTRVLKTA